MRQLREQEVLSDQVSGSVNEGPSAPWNADHHSEEYARYRAQIVALGGDEW